MVLVRWKRSDVAGLRGWGEGLSSSPGQLGWSVVTVVGSTVVGDGRVAGSRLSQAAPRETEPSCYLLPPLRRWKEKSPARRWKVGRMGGGRQAVGESPLSLVRSHTLSPPPVVVVPPPPPQREREGCFSFVDRLVQRRSRRQEWNPWWKGHPRLAPFRRRRPPPDRYPVRRLGVYNYGLPPPRWWERSLFRLPPHSRHSLHPFGDGCMYGCCDVMDSAVVQRSFRLGVPFPHPIRFHFHRRNEEIRPRWRFLLLFFIYRTPM